MKSLLLPRFYPVTCHTHHVGPGSTFVAIQGMKEDGTCYIEQALKQGATRIVVDKTALLSESTRKLIEAKNAQLMLVDNTRQAVAFLSAQAHQFPASGLKIIGITGTKGKTTTAFLIEHILRTAGHKTALLSTVHNKILDTVFDANLTTPQPDYLHAFFSVCRDQGVEFVIMEVAAQALTLHRVDTISFDAAVFTNFSLEHSEFYDNQEDYFTAKCALFKQLSADGRAFFNADDPGVAQYGASVSKGRTYGLHTLADFAGKVEQSDLAALKMGIVTAQCAYHLALTALLGEFNASNILAAVAVVEKYVLAEDIVRAVASFPGVPGRLQRFILPNNAVAFIDNAHTPSSFEAIFAALRPLSNHIIAVFGAGGDRDTKKRPLMGGIAASIADHIILTTDNPRSEDPHEIIAAIKAGIHQKDLPKVQCELDREKAIRDAYKMSRSGTIIALLGKGPVEYQQVGDRKIPFSERTILGSL